MPRVRRRGHIQSELTDGQVFELLLGPTSIFPGFANDRERRVAWIRYREELLDSVNELSRPWAFWKFEVGKIPLRVDGEREIDLLQELGLLTDREKTMLAGSSAFAAMLRTRGNHAAS